MISKVKTLNPKTKGPTIKEKGNRNARKWRLGVLATTSSSTNIIHQSVHDEAVNLILHIHSFMISKVQTLNPKP
jgi:hypothetical protein